MNNRKLVFGDVAATLGVVKARKGEGVWEALHRQGKEVREARERAVREATKRKR